jgi:hypothetical protein
MDWYWYVLIAAIGLFVISLFLGRLARASGALSIPAAQAEFQSQRSRLQKLFFDTAAASGKPRGLRWKDCQWNDLIEWVREKETGRLHALAGVTISFEAIEGGDMEGVEAVGNLRNATAVFFFDGEWRTAGRVVFNLNPDEAVVHFKDAYERVSNPS